MVQAPTQMLYTHLISMVSYKENPMLIWGSKAGTD